MCVKNVLFQMFEPLYCGECKVEGGGGGVAKGGKGAVRQDSCSVPLPSSPSPPPRARSNSRSSDKFWTKLQCVRSNMLFVWTQMNK